jgi:hypothetical protein
MPREAPVTMKRDSLIVSSCPVLRQSMRRVDACSPQVHTSPLRAAACRDFRNPLQRRRDMSKQLPIAPSSAA